MPKPEVLAPAGDLERVRMALVYGADAVYLSGPGFGMRPSGRLSIEDVASAADLCHRNGAKIYITCNTTPTDTEADHLPKYLGQLAELGADAVIVGDVGVLSLCRKHIPQVPVHISTQTGVMNAVTATALYDMGASRVIPARELSLDQLAELRRRTPKDLDIEVFVHGSLCVSFSGRCLLSDYFTGRDANAGMCAQPCRWGYALAQERRPGEYFPIVEEENGTYILNSRDLRLIEYIPELLEAGVCSLKIEGRTKSAYYVATVVNAYRHALDAALRGEDPDPLWINETECLSHRPYSTGFLFGMPGQHPAGSDYLAETEFVAVVEHCDARGNARLQLRNRFSPGDELELLIPGGEAPVTFTLGDCTDAYGIPLTLANVPMMQVNTRLPQTVPPWTIVRRRTAGKVRHRTQP